MSSQRFCLRWNNHQSNLLSVFDQLLHDESFVDVTLAVEGRFLRAHKMVLSACSPYFQALFVGHPDKHPIVILKDVPFSDMRSLLDFMYRGEVSVDQDRLTAFLKVAESLRIKGLTEVNEERCDLPSITSSLLSSSPMSHSTPPPHLHRIHPVNLQRRVAMPLLGSALTAPKRKRGRPRKLSGSSNVGSDGKEGDDRLGDGVPSSEEICEQNMVEAGGQRQVDGEGNAIEKINAMVNEHGSVKENHNSKRMKAEDHEPTPGTSADPSTFAQPGTRADGQTLEPYSIGKRESDEFDSESLPEDENDLITLSPSSSQSSFTQNPNLDANVDRRITLDSTNLSRLAKDFERFARNGSPSMVKLEPGEYSAEDLFQGFDGVNFGSDFNEDGSSEDKSGRKFCVREANNVFRCLLCSKTYTHISNFCRHYMTTHTNKKLVSPCPLCNKKFTRRDNMLVHMKTVHRYDATASNTPDLGNALDPGNVDRGNTPGPGALDPGPGDAGDQL